MLRKLGELPWTYRVAYILGTLLIVGPEIVAIFNNVSNDTITENTRHVIHIAPFFWYTTLGLWMGLTIWVIRHFWWDKQ